MVKRSMRLVLLVLLVLVLGGPLYAAGQGTLVVQAVDGVRVLVDGQLKVTTSGGSNSVVRLDAGTYRVDLEKDGFNSKSQSVLIKASETYTLTVDMQRPDVVGEPLGTDMKPALGQRAEASTVVLGQKTGALEIYSRPFMGAGITIDDVDYGLTNRRLAQLPVGKVGVQTQYDGRRLRGDFQILENETTILLADYGLQPARIVQLFDVSFTIPPLPTGFHAEVRGAYGTGTLGRSGEAVRLQGADHTVMYTDGRDYMAFSQRIRLTKSGDVVLDKPQVKAESMAFAEATARLKIGGSLQLAPVLTPWYAELPAIRLSSSDPRVATVTAAGLVKGISEGLVTITAEDTGGQVPPATMEVVVHKVAVTGVALTGGPVSLLQGGRMQLAATVMPADASDKGLTWASSDTTVVTVDSKGLVTVAPTAGIGKGAVITATANDGGFTATTEVVVMEKIAVPFDFFNRSTISIRVSRKSPLGA